MKVTILCVGKIKEKFYSAAVDEYIKRLGRYCTPTVIEVADEKTPDGASNAVMDDIKSKEGDRLLSHIKDNDYVIALTIDGKSYDSVGLSEHISNLMGRGNSSLVFVIGGSLGLGKKILDRANEYLSFSKLTFPHQLMRVILCEQIYRSFRIINNEPYHK